MADTWTPISGYTPQDYTDTAVFEVDSDTKKITLITGQALVAGEENSQYIKFVLDRYWDGIDIKDKAFYVEYALAGTYYGKTAAVNAEYNTEQVRFGWIVPKEACCISGTLLFVLRIESTDYVLKTQIAEHPVFKSVNVEDVVPEPTKEAWYRDFEARVETAIDDAETALTAAQAAQTAAENAALNAQTSEENAEMAAAMAQTRYGSPLTAAEADEMVEQNRVYVYVGNETGYTNGHWYYYNGTEWTDGGVYNGSAVNTDTTLTQSGMAADAKATGDEISQIKEDLSDYNCVNVIKNVEKTNRNHNGITYAWTSSNTCEVSGTSTAQSTCAIYSNTSAFPVWLEKGKTYRFKYSAASNVTLKVWFYKNGTYSSGYTLTSDKDILIPVDATGLVLRLQVESGQTVDTTATVEVLTTYTNKDLQALIDELLEQETPYQIADNSDLNDFLTNAKIIVPTSYTISNRPDTLTGMLEVIAIAGSYVVQRYSTLNTEYKQYLRRWAGSGFTAWMEFDAVSYTYNIINNSQSVTVNATPSISIDAEYYLKEADDPTTDRTAEILALLQTNGYCKLSKGTFAVSGLVMPNNSKLEGSGFGTVLALPESVSSGFVVSVRNYCLLSNMKIYGGASSYISQSAIGTRYGIIFQGSVGQDGTPVNVPRNSCINNVWIENFSGAGLLCQYTGTASIAALTVNDIWVNGCFAGIDIFRRSEYSHFTNCKVLSNHYGLINNGGNNFFVNCDFSRNVTGVLMDNSDGEAYNNTHGSMVGCSINHNDSNNGFAVIIKNMTNGFVFDGCNIFFGKVDISESQGIEFANMNIGSMYSVTIENSKCILFLGSMFNAAPTFDITNSDGVIVNNCYLRGTGEVINIT